MLSLKASFIETLPAIDFFRTPFLISGEAFTSNFLLVIRINVFRKPGFPIAVQAYLFLFSIRTGNYLNAKV